ncbi:MAG: hypothetical protein DSY42_00550, partial [Aquifex sp.]
MYRLLLLVPIIILSVGLIAATTVIEGSLPIYLPDYHSYGPMPKYGFIRLTLSGVCLDVKYAVKPVINLGDACVVLGADPGETLPFWAPLMNQYVGATFFAKPVVTTYSPEVMRIAKYNKTSIVLVNGTNFGYMPIGVGLFKDEFVTEARLRVINASSFTAALAISIGRPSSRIVMHITPSCSYPWHILDRPELQVFYSSSASAASACVADANDNSLLDQQVSTSGKISELVLRIEYRRPKAYLYIYNGSTLLLNKTVSIDLNHVFFAAVYVTAVNGTIVLTDWSIRSDWRYAKVYPPLVTIAYIFDVGKGVDVHGLFRVYPFATAGNESIRTVSISNAGYSII